MSEAKHTPGPWHVEDATGTAFDLPSHLNGNVHRSFLIVATVEPIAKTIAVHTEYGLRSEADARLIAASPDLLAACKMAIHLLSGTGEHPGRAFDAETCRALRAAIAKAEGGAA